MPLEVLSHVGLDDLAQKATAIIRRCGIPPDDASIAAILALSDIELAVLDRQFGNHAISDKAFSRKRYTILCGLHVLADEISMSDRARATLDQYLSHGSRRIPDTLWTSLPNDCRVECRMTDYVEFATWLYGVYEPLESYIFSHLLHDGLVVIDGGANIGQYSLLAATSVGATGAVHSFEPHPGNFLRLRDNVIKNDLGQRCNLDNRALWAREESLMLIAPSSSMVRTYRTNNGAYQVADNAVPSHLPEGQVAGVTLDAYARASCLKRIDVIKLDVEGAEHLVLDGAKDVLAEWRPLIFIELNDRLLAKHGASSQMVFDRMARLGYQFALLEGTPEGEKHYDCLFFAGDKPAILRNGWNGQSAQSWALRNALREDL